MIRAGRADQIGILALAVFVPRALHGRTVAISERQGLSTVSDRVYLVIVRVTVTRAEGRVAKHLLGVTGRYSQQLLDRMIGSRDTICAQEQPQIHQGSHLLRQNLHPVKIDSRGR
jgi:hypothetical protein